MPQTVILQKLKLKRQNLFPVERYSSSVESFCVRLDLIQFSKILSKLFAVCVYFLKITSLKRQKKKDNVPRRQEKKLFFDQPTVVLPKGNDETSQLNEKCYLL